MKLIYLLIFLVLIPTSALAHESILAHSHFMGEIYLRLSIRDYLLMAAVAAGLGVMVSCWGSKK